MGIGFLVADDLTVFQCPAGFGNEIQHGGDIIGIVYAISIVAVHIHIGGGLHLGGIGVGLHLKCGMGCGRCGYGAVTIDQVGALGLHGQDQSQTGIVTDHGTVARLDDVAVGAQNVCAVSVQIQADVHIETAVGFDHTGEIGAEELIVGHVVGVFIALVEGYRVQSLGIGLAVGNNGIPVQGERGFGNEVQDGALACEIIDTVGIAAVHVHVCCGFHLRGISVGLHLKCGMSRDGDRHGSVSIGHIGTFGLRGQDKTQTGVVTDLGAVAGFDDIGIREQIIAAIAVQLEGYIYIEAAVGTHHAGEIRAEELIVGHDLFIGVFVALVVGHGVGGGCGIGDGAGFARRGVQAQDTGEAKRCADHAEAEDEGEQACDDPFAEAALAALFALFKASGDVEDHGDEP